LPKQRKDEQRDAIVKTAQEMFLESGYDKVKIKDIAAACGISTSLLQYYFPKRADIAVACFYDFIIGCNKFVTSQVRELPDYPFDDADLVCLDAFYHLFYRILHADNDRLLRLYTVVLYDAELLKGGTDRLWSHPDDFVLPSRSFKSRVGTYALNGTLSQFVALYLADPLSNDLDSYVTLALSMYYQLLEVQGERLEKILAASKGILENQRTQEYAEHERLVSGGGDGAAAR
jgi:AcrR family transcriptional regulator